jgi:hypothetical protein
MKTIIVLAVLATTLAVSACNMHSSNRDASRSATKPRTTPGEGPKVSRDLTALGMSFCLIRILSGRESSCSAALPAAHPTAAAEHDRRASSGSAWSRRSRRAPD